MLKVLLAGASGLVGSAVAADLAKRDEVALTSLVRQPRSGAERKIDFEALVADPIGTVGSLGVDRADVAISCLGTTIRTAGSQAAFRRVDHDYVLGFARAALQLGARQFILVSSVGAGGAGFYLSVKGEIEEAVAALGFDRIDILRPGLLLGKRRERRVGEGLAQMVAPLLAPALRGGLSRYAAIEAKKVADAIVGLTGTTGSGRHVHHNPEILSWASSPVVQPPPG
jgi:uncharacterized protein YbjT (DUF2867 family)